MSQRLAIDLDDRLAERLREAAEQRGTTVEAFTRDAVEQALADAEAWVEDEAAYAQYEQTGEAIPLAAAEAWVRSWSSKDELPPPEPCKSSS